MIRRSLTDELITKLQNEEVFKVLWERVICDETLSPVFRNDKIDVYYRGYKLFSISTMIFSMSSYSSAIGVKFCLESKLSIILL